MGFIAVDVETTGLDPRRDEAVSFAGVPIESGRIVAAEAVRGLVRPRAAVSDASVAIHGLREEDLAAAPRAPEAFAPLAAAMRGRILVAHVAWVERAFLRKVGCRVPHQIVNTARLWRLLSVERGEPDPGSCNLSTVASALAVPSHRPHEAEGDALTTAQAFLALATHLERLGHGTVRGLTGARWDLRAWQLWHGRGGIRSG